MQTSEWKFSALLCVCVSVFLFFFWGGRGLLCFCFFFQGYVGVNSWNRLPSIASVNIDLETSTTSARALVTSSRCPIPTTSNVKSTMNEDVFLFFWIFHGNVSVFYREKLPTLRIQDSEPEMGGQFDWEICARGDSYWVGRHHKWWFSKENLLFQGTLG